MKKELLLAGFSLMLLAACRSADENTAAEKTAAENKSAPDTMHTVLVTDEIEMAPGSYPAGISEYYKKHYPNEHYKVWVHRDTIWRKAKYYTKRNNDTLHFDSKGTLVNGIQPGKGESHAITIDNQ